MSSVYCTRQSLCAADARAGSPFTVEVVDPGTVIAQGEGLISAQVHHQAVFTVCTDNAAGVNVSDCRITVYGTPPRVLLCKQ